MGKDSFCINKIVKTNRNNMLFLIIATLTLFPRMMVGQSTGKLKGQVILKETGMGVGGAEILVVELGQVRLTDSNGYYVFKGIPVGTYQVIAHLDSTMTEQVRFVSMEGAQTIHADFVLEFSVFKHEVTVTASGRKEKAFDSFQSVDFLDSFDLTEDWRGSLGETLDHRVGTGIAKRSFGPGSARPIIRGFDGDRVLIMKDNIRTGTLSSQSGDHGELLNLGELDRVEIIKGPASLLYGSSAMGGTINAISNHHDFSQHAHRHEGLRGFLRGLGGSANALGGSTAGVEYGVGNWMIFGSGGGLRTHDYNIPGGDTVFNSRSQNSGGRVGVSYYGDRTFFSLGGDYDTGEYGIPFGAEFHHQEEEGEGNEEEIERISIDARRWSTHINWRLQDPTPPIEYFVLKLNHSHWLHDEVEFFESSDRRVGTKFGNKQFVYRGQFEQKKRGPLTGRFGFWGITRDYNVTGEEAFSPPVDQDGFALFALEELDYERFRFQIGGRLEWNRYSLPFAESGTIPGQLAPARSRRFKGLSASTGFRTKLWSGGAFLINYYHTNRPPALDELYSFGPHTGNLAFEIGNPQLDAERGNGFDISLRHDLSRARMTVNYYFYDFSNFIFPFATGAEIDGLQEIEFTQLHTRFTGGEVTFDVGLHSNLWLNLATDYVNAKEKANNTMLPRIPPLRGKVGLDVHAKNLSIRPELVVANQQHLTFTNETRTPGYAVCNLKVTYSIPRSRFAHQFSGNFFNIGNRLYRNHSSFIKDLAPEIGRGVRFGYTLRFF